MFPRPPPKGVLTAQQDTYLRTAYGIGHRLMGTVAKFDYLGASATDLSDAPSDCPADNNLFGSMAMQFIQWEGQNSTVKKSTLLFRTNSQVTSHARSFS